MHNPLEVNTLKKQNDVLENVCEGLYFCNNINNIKEISGGEGNSGKVSP